MKLTEKQRRFVEAYMGKARGNATEAARIAGYKGSDATLRAVGAENLTKPNILAAIQERIDADEDGLIADREELQQFWTQVTRGRPEVDADLEDSPEVIKVSKPEMKDRLKASELLGKTQGLFLEKRQHSGSLPLDQVHAHFQRLRSIVARHVTSEQLAAIDAEIARDNSEAIQ